MGKPFHPSVAVFRKTPLSVHIASIVTLLALSASPCALAGETIIYDGTNNSLVKTDPYWTKRFAIYPGNAQSTDALSDNSVSITADTNKAPNKVSVYGSLSHYFNTVVNKDITANNNTVNVGVANENFASLSEVRGAYIKVSAKDSINSAPNTGNKITASLQSNNNIVNAYGKNTFTSLDGSSIYASAYDINGTVESSNNTLNSYDDTQAKSIIVADSFVILNNSSVEATVLALNNTLNIAGHSKVDQAVASAATVNAQSTTNKNTSTVKANHNTVNVSNESEVTTSLQGGVATSYMYANKGINASIVESNFNTVNITDNASVNAVIGGEATSYLDDKSYSTNNSTISASNNIINLSGNAHADSIIGGHIESVRNSPNTITFNSTETANNNTINVQDNATFDYARGGYSYHGIQGKGDLVTGNILNLQNWKGSATSIANFQTINVDAQKVGANGTVLSLSNQNQTVLGNGTDIGTTVNLTKAASGLVAGDVIHLIGTQNGFTGTLENEGQIQTVEKTSGFAAKTYSARIDYNPKNIDATILGNNFNPETKVLNESRVASLAFVNQGGDLLISELDHLKGKNIFGAIKGGHSRYDTGSSVDVDGVNLITGVTNTWKQGNGDLTAGAFIEAGWGDTSTSNTIGGNKLKGSGDTNYYGVGLLGRYDFTEGSARGLYVDGSLRAGKLSNKYHNNDLIDVQGTSASFDIDSTYYGAHIGTGYLWQVSNAYQLDFNVRYLWTHVESDSANMAGDKFSFDSMDSHRTRLGTRLNYTANPKFTPYAAVAWEYEFNGDAGGSVLGLNMDEASLGGSTGIFELGVDFKPTENGNLTVNAGVTGYVGEREGVAGQIRMNYAF